MPSSAWMRRITTSTESAWSSSTTFLEKNGVSIDKQNRNPSRLSRMPGVTRNGNRQYLVATNIGRKSWVDWMDFVEGISDELPDMVFLDTFKDNPPELPEELITGILRRGHKMLISGSSKAGKSFLLMELCIAIAEGKPWLGFPCKKGRVLYVNLEIDPAKRDQPISQNLRGTRSAHQKCGQHRGVEPQRSRRTARPACSETHPPLYGISTLTLSSSIPFTKLSRR